MIKKIAAFDKTRNLGISVGDTESKRRVQKRFHCIGGVSNMLTV